MEMEMHGFSDHRTLLIFKTLDEFIPKLGVHSKLFNRLRTDLYKVVYSEQLTSVQGSPPDIDIPKGGTQKLPYYALVDRMYNEQHERIKVLNEKLETVTERLFNEHKLLEQALHDLTMKQDAMVILNTRVEDLMNVIVGKDAEINRINEEIKIMTKTFESDRHSLQCDISEIDDLLSRAKEEIQQLTPFKRGYDEMYYAFMKRRFPTNRDDAPSEKDCLSSQHACTVSDIESACGLEQQILTVLNIAMDEFDGLFEANQQQMLAGKSTDPCLSAAVDLYNVDSQLDEAGDELELALQQFRYSTGSLLSELELLRRHRAALTEHARKMDDDVRQSNGSAGDRSGHPATDDCLWNGLEGGEEKVVNPFVPQEHVFNKCAAMLHTSVNGGKTFEDFRIARHCTICGVKTVICLHKTFTADNIFPLPVNCTHVKITQPVIHLSHQLSRTMEKEPSRLTQPSPLNDSLKSGKNDHSMTYSLDRLFDDYSTRTDLKRLNGRTLSLERTLYILGHFCAYVMMLEVTSGADHLTCCSILDKLYGFLLYRYALDDVAFLAMHDFLSAIIAYSTVDTMIQLVGQVLVGNLEDSCLQYILLMADFVLIVDWEEVEDFRSFASVVYPFMAADDLESLQMSYTSFSENSISSRRVMDFLIHLVLKHREPRFADTEDKLLAFRSSEVGRLSNLQHRDAMDSIAPLFNECMRQRLYQESLKAISRNDASQSVSLNRLAQISSLLALHEMTTFIKENVHDRVIKWRNRPKSRALSSQFQGLMSSSVSNVMVDGKILRFSDIKVLSDNMARIANRRKSRPLV